MISGVGSLVTPNLDHPLNQGLVYWWLPLAHTIGGGKVVDLMPAGRHGSLFTAALATWSGAAPAGRLGSVSTTAGTTGHIRVFPNRIVAGLANWTVSGWVRTTALWRGGGRAVYCERGAAGNDILKIDSMDGGATFGQHSWGVTYRNTAGTLTQLGHGGVIDDGLWHHLVLILRNGTFLMHMDGGVAVSGARGGNDTLTSSLETRIGGDAADTNGVVIGHLTDFRVHNRAFTLEYVKQLYEEGRAGYPNLLMRQSKWQFTAPAVDTGGPWPWHIDNDLCGVGLCEMGA